MSTRYISIKEQNTNFLSNPVDHIQGSMLASEGFAVLCVAFFEYKDLVKDLSEVELEYFEVMGEALKGLYPPSDNL